MLWQLRSRFACVLAVAALGGCGGSVKQPEFRHMTLGVVPGGDPRVVAVRDQCGKAAYAKGIEIDGRKVTDRNVALDARATNLVNQAFPPGAGAMAGVQGAMAVRTGNPNYGVTPGASATQELKMPPYSKQLDELERETWTCVEKAGFKRVES